MKYLGLPGYFTSRVCRSPQGVGHEAMVFHRKWTTTWRVRRNRLARWVNKAENSFQNYSITNRILPLFAIFYVNLSELKKMKLKYRLCS